MCKEKRRGENRRRLGLSKSPFFTLSVIQSHLRSTPLARMLSHFQFTESLHSATALKSAHCLLMCGSLSPVVVSHFAKGPTPSRQVCD